MNAPARPQIVLLPIELDELVDRIVERLAEHVREPEAERLLDRGELAARLGVSVRSVDTLRQKKGFPEVAVLEAPRFVWADVIGFLRGAK